MNSPIHERLTAAIGHFAVRYIAEKTSTNPEYVNRYLRGMPPTPEFVAGVCRAFDISADWLLLGRGPVRGSDVKHHALRENSAPDLISALSASVQKLMDRLDDAEEAASGRPRQARMPDPARSPTPGG